MWSIKTWKTGEDPDPTVILTIVGEEEGDQKLHQPKSMKKKEV